MAQTALLIGLSGKEIIAIVSVILTLAGYVFYFRDIFARKTTPHAYSWLVWSILTIIAFAAQVNDGAGPGAWTTGATGFISLVIVLLSIKYGTKDITKSDKINLAASLGAIVPWLLLNDALLSVLLITVIDFLGFLPTIRKSIAKPYSETLAHYVFAGLKFALAILALEVYTVETWLYIASLVVANWGFVVMLIILRRGARPKVKVA